MPSTGGYVTPYAVSGNATAAAFYFAPTLSAASPTNPATVLWVMRYPRGGQPLTIFGRCGSKPWLIARSSWPADASAGEIQPSYVNLPKAGGWELTLGWNGHRAHIDVEVHPRTH